ncbi:MAG: hypothetical protein IJ573_00935 [Clostridia bacterium]|nr:hypothetical protein [Clostridia bacterium]
MKEAYKQAKALEDRQLSQGKRNMATAYAFLILSAVFFFIFFFKVKELPLAGCAFLCDAAAVIYLRRAAIAVYPFRQASLAAKCAAQPTQQTVLALCACLERAGKNVRYGKGPRERFGEALAACERAALPAEVTAMLKKTLKEYIGDLTP